MRANGKTYKDVADCLELSEPSVKRLFADQGFTLDRLEKICLMLDIELLELMRSTEQQRQHTSRLSMEQERELVGDIRLLLVAHSLMNKWNFEQIIDTYRIDQHEGIQLLARLDRMKIIELLPGNRTRLLIAQDFSWIPDGPIQRFFEQQIQAEFFQSRFAGKGEYRQFVSGMLSEAAILELISKLRKVVAEFNDRHQQDEILPLEQRYGTSLLLATRPWESRVFADFRRQKNTKTL
nr:helix-turn-helix transcriptional regulator [Oceanobacter mangrovi]